MCTLARVGKREICVNNSAAHLSTSAVYGVKVENEVELRPAAKQPANSISSKLTNRRTTVMIIRTALNVVNEINLTTGRCEAMRAGMLVKMVLNAKTNSPCAGAALAQLLCSCDASAICQTKNSGDNHLIYNGGMGLLPPFRAK